MNRKPLVKICGFRDPYTASAVARLEAPVDYAGFVFAPSKRRVDPAEARLIMEAFGERPPAFVGVFVNPTLDELDRVLSTAPLDVIQLHGAETADYCREVQERYPGVSVWKALGVSGEAAHDEAAVERRLNPFAGIVDAILLDAWDPVVGGGTGHTFHWDVIPSYRKWADRHGITLFIAGGLHADNVPELLASAPVDAVDVSSGVETDGQKDIEKICKFTERVKGRR